MFNKKFWIESTERAVNTLAQTFFSLSAANAFLDVFNADWQTLAGVSVGAAVLSYATSLVSANIGPDKGSPSLVE